tara:strand:- start:12396 stop:12650 length:255 start_codon:yes stop_codon:yes gene_type:complete
MKHQFFPQTNNNRYEIEAHQVLLTGNEISTILYNLEKTYGHLLDGEIPEEVQTIFSKLEGVTDAYYERLEKLEYNRKHEERRIK